MTTILELATKAKWWASLSLKDQKAYLKDHPRSKLKPTSKSTVKEAEKPAAKGAGGSVKLTNGLLVGVPAHRKLFDQMIGESADIKYAMDIRHPTIQKLISAREKDWRKQGMHLKSKKEQNVWRKGWEDKIGKLRLPNGKTKMQKLGDLVTEYARWGFDNNKLRRGEKLSSDDAKVMKGLDEIMTKASLPIELKAFRFVNKESAARLEKLVGKSYTEKGFTSTTTNPDELMKHAKKANMSGQHVRVRIVMPKGSKAIPIAHLSSHPKDNEILIGRDQKFNITKSGKELVLTVVP